MGRFKYQIRKEVSKMAKKEKKSKKSSKSNFDKNFKITKKGKK
jgi:hypothetical protein